MATAEANGSTSRDRVHVLYEVTRQFASTLELEAVLGKVLETTVRAVAADAGSIFQLDEAGYVTRSILARGDVPARVGRPIVDAVMSDGLAGWVFRQRSAALIPDTRQDVRWHFFADDRLVTLSAMAAPLLRHDRVVGIVTMMHREPGAFDADDLELLEAIAAQAAVAIENASHYEEAKRERARLAAVIASAHDAIVETDVHDRVVRVNPAGQRVLGLEGSVAGCPVADAAGRELAALYAEQVPVAREIALADGRVFDCALVELPGGGKVLGMHDITTLKNLDALKSEFVAHVAHDLRAPLGVIQGNAWLLADLPQLGDEDRGVAREILDAIQRMRALIDNVLDVGRIEMGLAAELVDMDLAPVLRAVLAASEVTARRNGVALEVDVAVDLPPVCGSALRLEQAVANLLGNALKFTPAGGRVRLSAAPEDGWLVVRVADSGPGIPSALHGRLFRKFSTLGDHRQHEGNGLGLAIVKTLVEAHGGRVWVESEVGQGAVFGFALPARSSA